MILSGARALLIFTRAPEAEARLKGLSQVLGTRLFEAFLQSWRQRATSAGAELIIVAPQSSVSTLRRFLPAGDVVLQVGASFGDRVEAAFALAFRRGAASVLMVSGDSPPLDLEEVNGAFAHLETNRCAMALAPAVDGGVNAIGFGAGAERRLACLTWLGPRICQELKSLARQLGLTVLLTQPGHDLDCAKDIRALYRLSLVDRRWIPFRWLLHFLRHIPHEASGRATSLASRWSFSPRFIRGPPVYVPKPA